MTARFARLAAQFERDIEQLIDSTISMTMDRIPDFTHFPVEQLRPATAAVYQQALAALPGRRQPSAAELRVAGQMAAVRAEQGVPIDLYLRGFRLTAGEAVAWSQRYVQELGLSAEDVLDLGRYVWSWTDEVTAHAADAHQRALAQLARRTNRSRDELVVRLLTGRLPLAELAHHAALWGMRPNRQVVAVRAEAADSGARRAVRDRLSAVRSALVVGFQGDVCALLPAGSGVQLPTLAGVGAPVPLYQAQLSFAQAGEALSAGRLAGRTGLVTLADMALEAAVLRCGDLGELLVERLLGPLGSGAGAGGLVELVRCWLECDCETALVAERMFLHPNTVRYRLRRFQELTGLDLDSARTRFELWWALTASGAGD